MRHLKKTDPQHTVIMVQVENEPGTWGAVRDYSPAAQKLFDGSGAGRAPGGAWGRSRPAPERRWTAGVRQGRRRVLPRLGGGPLRRRRWPPPARPSTRCRSTRTPRSAIRSRRDRPAPTRAAGRPTTCSPIWKAAAPALDLLAPDIYMDDCARYRRCWSSTAGPRQPALRARDRPIAGRRPLLLRRARAWRDRLVAVRDRPRWSCGPCAAVAPADDAAAGALRHELPRGRPDDAGDRAAGIRGSAARGRRGEGRPPASRSSSDAGR